RSAARVLGPGRRTGAGRATRHRRPPGFAAADELDERYATLSGRPVDDLAFYRALGCFKLAVIAEGIHQRHQAGKTVGDGFDTVGEAVPALLERGLQAP